MGRNLATVIRRMLVACRVGSRVVPLAVAAAAGLAVHGGIAFAQGGAIVLGEPVAGLVTNERGDAWTIELRQGMFLRIELARERTSSLNAEVSVVAEGGRVVATGRANSIGLVRLTASCLPRNGRYSIVARSVEGRLGGRYQLRVDPILVADELGAETVACPTIDEATDRSRGECARPLLNVEATRGGAVRVPRGETRHIVLPTDGTVRWTCEQQSADVAPERVSCAEGSTILRVSRPTGSRAVEWTCLSRRFVDEAPADGAPATERGRLTRFIAPRAVPPAEQAAP